MNKIINKVLYNVDQTADTSEAERRLARKNIGLDEVIGHATTDDDTGIAPLGENGLVPAEYLKNASTSEYGVAKLTSTPGTGETLAMTPKGVQTAIAALDANVGSTGGTNVALTVTEADGVITGVSITKDDTSEIKLWKGGSSGSVHQNLMTIYEGSSTGALANITFNNENSTVTMVKTPTTGDGGKVLTVVEPGGQVSPYYEWKEITFPAVVKTYHSSTATPYTWSYTGTSSNYSKAAVPITGLEPNKLHTVEFSMEYTQNYAAGYHMFVFASASETNMGVPTGYARTSTRLGDPVDGMTPRLINCSWTLNSSANGEIFINIAGNADPDNATNRVTLNTVNYTVTRLK